jgi:2-keto-3-deoxy-L-rhamnonate aldolase RhmA
MADSEYKLAAGRAKQILRSGGSVLGTVVSFSRSPGMIRLIAAAGFDLVFIDMEHTSMSIETVGDLCDMARASGVTPVVRPYALTATLGNRLQDIGATGLMFPDIVSRKEVEEILSWMYYPPLGSRGHTDLNAAQDYQRLPADVAKRLVNENTMVIIQAESAEGVDRIEEILGPGGVDVVQIGRGDLSTSLGVPGQQRHPLLLSAIDRVVAACDKYGAAAGVACSTIDDAQDMIARGVRCLSFSNDRLLLGKLYHDMGAQFRQLFESRPDSDGA